MNELLSKNNLKTLRSKLDAQLADTLITHPELTYPEVASVYGVSRFWVTKVAKAINHHRPTGRKPQGVK
jgi:hypothetical protein